MTDDCFLITGALGCIGAWVVHGLVKEKTRVVVFDLGSDPARLRLLIDDEALSQVTFVKGDITQLSQLEETLDAHPITRVIHLAGLQIPFCRANPALGAQVNVVGTVNIFEAAKRRKDRIQKVVYASSIGVFGQSEDYPEGGALSDDAPLVPHTLYGVYKQANEGTAHVYWLENGVSSVGLRPYVVYGVGRDQGLTSAPTLAMLAAAVGRPYHIGYGGRQTFQHAGDVARAFVQAARSSYQGCGAFNLGGYAPHMSGIVATIGQVEPRAIGQVTFENKDLPYPPNIDGSGLDEAIGKVVYRSLLDGVSETISAFRKLVDCGKMDPDILLKK